MNDIEAIIVLLLLFMSVPDLCQKLGRPALAFSVFVVFGILLAPWVDSGVEAMMKQAGQVGFLLLLFEVGLEIDLPPPRELLKPLRFASVWVLAQYPMLMLLAVLAGAGITEAFIGTAALTACSVGMAHGAWKNHPWPDDAARTHVLRVMVLLEMLAIVLLSVETVVLEKGFSWWVPLKLLGIGIAVLLVARFAKHLKQLFQLVLERTTHWRMHFLVLLLLVVCAVGERLGLSAAKTAFVLGLFMSRAEHDGQGLEKYMAPISHRFLIPIFFVALGLQIEWNSIVSWTALLALGTAGLLLGAREVLHRRWLKAGGGEQVFLLFCPNLTLVALAASALLKFGSPPEVITWLLLTGLFLTVGAIFLLPKSGNAEVAAGTAQPEAAKH